MKFPESSAENKVFIQNVALHELKHKFSIEELDILLRDQDDDFIVNALRTYPPEHFDKVDTFDRWVVAELICDQIIGLEFDLSMIEHIKGKISSEPNWINNLHDLSEIREYREKRIETTRRLIIDNKLYPDVLKISSLGIYTNVIADFLIENKDELLKRLTVAQDTLFLKNFSESIFKFLEKFAEIKADHDPEFDDEDEKFASPDASILYAAATILSDGNLLPQDFSLASSWESGGYTPYSSKEGKIEHDLIISKLSQLKTK